MFVHPPHRIRINHANAGNLQARGTISPNNQRRLAFLLAGATRICAHGTLHFDFFRGRLSSHSNSAASYGALAGRCDSAERAPPGGLGGITTRNPNWLERFRFFTHSGHSGGRAPHCRTGDVLIRGPCTKLIKYNIGMNSPISIVYCACRYSPGLVE